MPLSLLSVTQFGFFMSFQLTLNRLAVALKREKWRGLFQGKMEMLE
jgi:hypothetical protein